MYKTVRHGENSLQYRILAQQEEGVANIKCRRSPRSATIKLITVVLLLIIGIIASAVLVPLVLTNDFIALTGTFQKFSMSTLRRSHSGNHVVVIAKKPYGWNAAHSSVSPKPSNASQTHSNDAKKLAPGTNSIATTTETIKVIQTTKTTIIDSLHSKTTSRQPGETKETERPVTETTATIKSERRQEFGKARPTASATQQQRSFQKQTGKGSDASSSTLEPVWFEPVKKWRSSDSFFNLLNGIVDNSLAILFIFFFVVVIVTMFFFLRKTLPKRRNLTEEERGDSKEDKTRLLKPSVSSDHDEE